ncbi:2-deoxyglucose-6-phosphate phosphatase 1 [Cyphellophora attinorum]|uniref:2-deoxyglucose-6-phosphate phosphatase 1 n=1 Tax=Cyphellophora attinorum TaxID=1664694 RepID=A0A0N1P1Z2_9EURO|nr:2-deoxyglucose-6-phosphate phosphatase 1 [Phialophora attinorum]KPI42636.1 2-deoxyglucose-6-phosphate phosphatase 1 [Phialophora attinorum]
MGSLGDSTASFSAPTEVISADGLLFDFDGTIIDSTEAIVKHWQRLGHEMGVDPEVILATSHGRRSIDVLRLYDESKANWEYISELEGRIPKEFGQDADEIPGARSLLHNLDAAHAPWAVVTSGTRALITGWIERLKLAKPEVLVVAEEVSNGKPDPEGYLLGRERLGLQDKQNMIVFEDAPSGIRAGKAAGFRVVGLATTHTLEQVRKAGADWIIKDLRSISLKSVENGVISIAIHDALVDS